MADDPRVWTIKKVRKLGTTTTVEIAAEVLGIGRTKAYALAKDGQFPTPILRIGNSYVVPVAPLLNALGSTSEPAPIEAPRSTAKPQRATMNPDRTLAKFWAALEQRRQALLRDDIEAEIAAADEAVEQAHNLFSWLAAGRPAPDWTKRRTT